MADKRPVSQRDLKRRKQQEQEIIEITNCSKQVINIQTREPGKDFYIGEDCIPLRQNQTMRRPLKNVMMEQVSNLKKRGMLRYRIRATG